MVARIPYQAEVFCVEFIYNQIGKIRSMTGGQAGMPIVLWIGGAGRRQGSAGQHTDVGAEVLYTYMAGLKVVVPSNAYDAKGLMIAAIRDPEPRCVSRLQRWWSLRVSSPIVPDEAYEVPIGKAVVRQEGKDVTIVAWAPAPSMCPWPCPTSPKPASAPNTSTLAVSQAAGCRHARHSGQKDGEMLVVDHGNYTAGFGSHVIAEVVQKLPA